MKTANRTYLPESRIEDLHDLLESMPGVESYRGWDGLAIRDVRLADMTVMALDRALLKFDRAGRVGTREIDGQLCITTCNSALID